MFYDYLCSHCDVIYEIQHSMTCTDTFNCPECNEKLEKQFHTNFIISSGMKPTLEEYKQTEKTKKVKDFSRAIRSRKRAFGRDSVGDPVDKPDPRHIVKRGKHLAGGETQVDIKELAKNDYVVEKCKQALNKKK